MKLSVCFLFLFMSFTSVAQHTISGRVTDRSGNPIGGANVYLKNSYAGGNTDEDGKFSFTSTLDGEQILVISFIAFESTELKSKISQMNKLEIRLRADVNSLDAVVLNAGSFSAGDQSRASVLKPLDVVTTAGVAGDFIAALQTLPGTQAVGEDGRLFVRGGTAEETQIFIDGLRVFQPYTATAQNLPARGRYSPFLFDGISFSTGGYSAEYGQALSSVLTLATIDEPDQNQTDISIMTVGAGLGHTKKWDSSSVSINTTYINLSPYQELIPNNPDFEFKKPFENLSGEAVFRKKTSKGLFKLYTALDRTNFEIYQPDENFTGRNLVDLTNLNLYANTSYEGNLGQGWKIAPGFSFSRANNEIFIDEVTLKNRENAAHLKLKTTKRYNNRLKFHAGLEYFYTDFMEDYMEDSQIFSASYTNNILAGFIESDFIFSKKFAVKAGLRSSYLKFNDLIEFSPRLAAAYKLTHSQQISLAYGNYHQQPVADYLKYSKSLQPEKAQHFILNYQYSKKGYLFRSEAYYKNYSDLVKFDTASPEFNSSYSNKGVGYARGLDLFFRDDKTINRLEYWLSYSFIDTERDYRNYPVSATPDFVANHAASLVTKYWIEDWQSQIGFSYNFSSGRPFENPNTPGFLNERTKNYNNLSFNWAYLISQQKILYFSISNIMGSNNIFGYQYSNTPDTNGNFISRPIQQAADRFVFLGFFWTISVDKNKNQLNNL
ncbi:carboxypeptidase-like regulatory domain-containing protein [Salegentibacter sp. Hel_I_6]|uniref:TonB-dependent receptor n=1 Tax=Salegentibacter sp. Hel_I_6 TaxID=1250278 RepID=UPI000567B986|nr:carboxypeptidase-like regulatory domain-containing protein [Salegentibacter sp. Hel_I_6]